MKPFEIVAKGNADADVFIYGDIGDSWNEESVTAAKFVRDLQNVDAKTINVRINSFGGSVSDALAIYNALARHPATINTHIDGVAISAASLIAMAGKSVSMAENAALMIHGPSAMAAGNAQTMREAADLLDRFAAMMTPAYVAKSGKAAKEVLAMLTDGTDHWFTATEAKDEGFADQISAAVAVEASFDLRRFHGVPAAAAAFSRSSTMPDKITAAPPTAATNQPVVQASLLGDGNVPAAPTPVAVAPAALQVVTNPRTQEQIDLIVAAFAPFLQREGVQAAYVKALSNQTVTVEQARAQLLEVLGRSTTPANPPAQHVQIEMGKTDAQKFQAAASSAIMARAGVLPATERAALAGNPYRGHKLLDLARASLERGGVDSRGWDQMRIVATAFTMRPTSAITHTTSDFSSLLENTMHKTLLAAYESQPDTWRRFCAVGTVSDFRAHNRYRTATIGNLDTVNEAGEFKYKPLDDGEKSTITATTKGNLISITRQAIINDDLGAFVGLSAAMGRAAARSVEASVYALLDDNTFEGPTMTDGGILFNTTAVTTTGGHANRTAYATPTVALLDTLAQQMMVQMAPGGDDYLSLQPQIALTRPSLASTIKILNGAVYDPTVTTGNPYGRPNAVAGIVSDIVVSPRITVNAVYLFADPAIAPVFEVAFLDGNQTPFLETQQGFTVDGTIYKVRLDWGVGVVDYRGGVALVGA